MRSTDREAKHCAAKQPILGNVSPVVFHVFKSHVLFLMSLSERQGTTCTNTD